MLVKDVLDMVKKYSLLTLIDDKKYNDDKMLNRECGILKCICGNQNIVIKNDDENIFDEQIDTGVYSSIKIIVFNIISLCNKRKKIYEIESIIKYKQEESLIKSISKKIDIQFFVDCIDKMIEWSSQTYENQSISFSLGVVIDDNSISCINIKDFYKDDMLKVLTSCTETMIICNAKGYILSYEHLDDINEENSSPYVFRNVVKWTSKDRFSIVLTGRGDILIFYDKKIYYARRGGKWYIAKESLVTHKLQETLGYSKELKKALVETCFDVSFRRTGACIGISDRKIDILDEKNCIDDLATANERTKFLNRIIGKKKFQELHRTLRQELVAIDGATILRKDGTIVAIGAILKIDSTKTGGEPSGGRTVAAKSLASYGVGIKVSADGRIVGWEEADNGIKKIIDMF